jgi:hypothetical protein
VLYQPILKGSPRVAVKVLPCDHEVMGSSPRTSLLQKCRERLRTLYPKQSDPSMDLAQAGAMCTMLALFFAPAHMAIYAGSLDLLGLF